MLFNLTVIDKNIKMFAIERNVKKLLKTIGKLLKQHCFISKIKFVKQIVRFSQTFNKRFEQKSK